MGVGSSSPEIPGGGTEGYHVLRVSVLATKKSKQFHQLNVDEVAKFRPYISSWSHHVSLFWLGKGAFNSCTLFDEIEVSKVQNRSQRRPFLECVKLFSLKNLVRFVVSDYSRLLSYAKKCIL